VGRSARKASDAPKLPAHRLLLAADVRDWAGDLVGQAGRRHALLGRVERLRLAPNGKLLEARVRGHGPVPYRVEVWVDGDLLSSRCTCPEAASPVCKHAVAAIEALRFPLVPPPAGAKRRRGPQRQGRGRVIQPADAQTGYLLYGGSERTLTRDERVAEAEAEERAQRRHRARRDRAKVVPLPGDDGPPRFDVAERGADVPARVVLRGAKRDVASCTCDDFATSELGTCRHVERVRAWAARRPKEPIPRRVSVSWRPRRWTDEPPEPLHEIRVDHDAPEAEPLAAYFDAEGWLRAVAAGRTPDEWADEALAAAAACARARGIELDVDPVVGIRIDAARAERAGAAARSSVEPGDPIWREVVSRLGFALHPYQEIGATFLARRGRAMLADDMGLGKTVQAIAATLVLRRTAGARRALVVCPASLKHQWRREIDKSCGEIAVVVEGPAATRLAAYRAWTDGFLVLNYELLLRDLEPLRAIAPELVILDEAQRIKNWHTQTARAVKRLESPHAFILTGTPLENRLLELHSLVEFLHPRALGPRWRLLPFHAVVGPEGRVIAYEGLEVLRRRLDGYFLRRDRREVLHQLPERTETTFWTGMTPAQRRPYRRCSAVLGKLVARRAALGPAEVRAMLQALTHMRILSNALAQHDWARVAARLADPAPPTRAEIRALGSPKLEEFARVLEDLLDDCDGKVVVFSQWERMVRLASFVARDALARRELHGAVFHGGLVASERERILASFRDDPRHHVLFSTDAGGLGLNLQDSASIVAHLEVPWNPAVLEQRIGRVHRLGQRRGVRVLHFVTRGAIEERIRQVVEAKRALFEGLLGSDADRIEIGEPRRSSLVRQVRTLLAGSDAPAAAG